MSSDTYLFIPGEHTLADVSALLRSALPEEDRKKLLISEHPNRYVDQYATCVNFTIEDNRDAENKASSQLFALLSRDLRHVNFKEDMHPAEYISGLRLSCNVHTKWLADILKDVWKKQGGYYVENDGHDSEYVYGTGSEPLISSEVRSKGIAESWLDRIKPAIKGEADAILSPDDQKQLEDGFRELAECLIKRALDDRQHKQQAERAAPEPGM